MCKVYKMENRISRACFLSSLFLLACIPEVNALAAEITILEEVVIEQEGEPEPDLPLGIGISGETLKKIPGSSGDPLRGLQSLPGLAFADDSGAEPAVRGSRPGDNYYEVDFIPVGYLFHAGGVISVFNSELVDSFSLYPSAYGAEYAGVTGAVVDVRLRDPKTDRFHTTIDASFLQTGVLLEGPVSDTQSFYLAGRMSYLDLFVKDQLDDEDGIEFKQFPKYTDYQGKYLWQLGEGSQLNFQMSGATDEQELVIADDSEEIDNEPIFAGRHLDSSRFDGQGVVWNKELANRIRVKSAIAHGYSAGKSQVGNAGRSDIKIDRWLLKSHATVPVSQKHDFTFGAEAAHIKADIEVAFNDPACTEFETDCLITDAQRITTTQTLKISSGHLFLKDSWFSTDRLTLISALAVQSEDYLDKTFIEPRFSMEYTLPDDWILTAGLGQYHQIPQFNQINKDFGNPDLDYIEALHSVVGLQKKFVNGWDVKSELYYKKLNKLVTGNELSRYSNDGEGYAVGLDTLIRKKVSSKLSGWLALSLSKAKRKNTLTGDSFAFDFDQPFNTTLVASYKLSARWELGAKLWVHSGAPYTPVIGASPDDDIEGLYIPEYGPVNSKRTRAYNRLDIRIDRQFKPSSRYSVNAYLEILNLLDSKNISDYDYNQDYTERTAVTQLPRLIGIGLKAEF